MQNNIAVTNVAITDLKANAYNPRKWDKEAIEQLTESIKRFGLVDPILVNNADNRKNVVIGGHFRLKVAQDLSLGEVPVIYLDIPDVEKEKELNIRLNKNLGEWDYTLLSEFSETILDDIGFTSEEIDDVFYSHLGAKDEVFDLEKELAKLKITEIKAKKGDVYQVGTSRLMVGDSTISEDIEKLMNNEKADLCLTDPPYILDYLHAKRAGQPVTGFGAKKNRRYLETESLPDDFTELWMHNIKNHSKDDFSIIVYENWKNLRTIWGEMEKHWKVKNMIVWHLPNRHQRYAAKHKFFSKYDIAMVGASGTVQYNDEPELDGLQEEYETAIYAISGDPHWEGYDAGKFIQPTDFIDFQADDLKHSGQGIIFGTKPIEILIPYIKVLTKRGDLVVEPFCGSGSTLIASTILNRRCYIMEKSPIYAEVALKRWENLTGNKRILISHGQEQ